MGSWLQSRPAEASFENPDADDGMSWTLLPAILPPVLDTAGLDMHLLVAGKGQSGQRCSDAEAQAPLTAQAVTSLRVAVPRNPEEPSRGPSAHPAVAATPRGCGLGLGAREWPGRERRPRSRPVAGAAPGLSRDDSAESSVTGPPGTETHAGKSVLTAGHPCHDEGPGLPQGSRRRFSLS